MGAVSADFQLTGVADTFDVDVNRVSNRLNRGFAGEVPDEPVCPADAETDSFGVEDQMGLEEPDEVENGIDRIVAHCSLSFLVIE